MWKNETIFSIGDLTYNDDEYKKFIKEEYNGSYIDRCTHVQNMILRLQAEYGLLDEMITKTKEELK